jgi:hypothetical protein
MAMHVVRALNYPQGHEKPKIDLRGDLLGGD